MAAEESQLHNKAQKNGGGTERRGIIAILLAALALRLCFVFITPAWDSPDEYPHYWVADQIALTDSFPDYSLDFPLYEAYQPPLHYVLTAGVLRITGMEGSVPEFRDTTTFPPPASLPIPSSLILLRLLSVLMGLLTLLIAWRTLKGLQTLNTFERLGSLGFIAFLPTYVGITSSVNNDALVILLSGVAIHYAMKEGASHRDLFFAGLAAGFALLTKTSAVVILPIFLFLLLRSYRNAKRGEGSLAGSLLFPLMGVSIGLSMLLVRNLLQYDSLTAIVPAAERSLTPDPANVARAVRNLFWSFWVAFGRTYNLRPPDLLYPLLFLPLCIIAVIGVLRGFRRHGGLLQPALAALMFGVALSIGFTISYPAGIMTSWGKNLYPLLPLIAPVAVIGWNNALGRNRHAPAIIAILSLLLCCLWGVWRITTQP